MKATYLMVAAVVGVVAGETLQAQDLPRTLPVPDSPLQVPALPPRSDKIMVNPREMPVKPDIPAAEGERLKELGSRGADAKTAGEVKESLVRIVKAATSSDGFVDLIGNLSRADRERMGDVRGEELKELNKTVAQLKASFQEKYQRELQFEPEHFKDANVNLGAQSGTVTVSLSDLEKSPAAKKGDAGKPAEELSRSIPEQTGLNMIAGPVINLVKEPGASASSGTWRVNIANEISARQLRENLTVRLQKVSDQKATWGEDGNITTRAIAAQVLESLNDSTLASDR